MSMYFLLSEELIYNLLRWVLLVSHFANEEIEVLRLICSCYKAKKWKSQDLNPDGPVLGHGPTLPAALYNSSQNCRGLFSHNLCNSKEPTEFMLTKFVWGKNESLNHFKLVYDDFKIYNLTTHLTFRKEAEFRIIMEP